MSNFKTTSFFLVFVFTAYFLYSLDNFDEMKSSKDRLIYEAMKEAQKDIKAIEFVKNKIQTVGSGIGSDQDRKVNMISMSFYLFGLLSKEAYRDFIIKAGNILVDKINKKEELRQMLCAYPYTINNIELDLYIRTSQNEGLAPPNFSVITLRKSIINYTTVDPETRERKTISETIKAL